MANSNPTDLRYVPIDSIHPSEAALRQVNKEGLDFHEFVESVRSKGILLPLLVRPMTDEETGSKYFALIDGLHRYTAAKELGIESVPVNIITANNMEALESQIVANIHQIETKPAQYADGLKRLLAINNTLTTPQLAEKLGKSPSWLSQRLRLTQLPAKVKELVDDGKINVTNAQALASLPEGEIPEYLDRAMSMIPQQFLSLIKSVTKELRDAARQGREPRPQGFIPTPHLRGTAPLKEELSTLQAGKSLIHQLGCETPLDGWKSALEWACHMDPDSVKEQERKYNEDKKLKEENRAKLKAEKEQKKMENAAKEAAVAVS